MVSNSVEVKQLNVERIRRAVQSHESCTKADIANETLLSVATCSTILNEMAESGEIIKIDQKDSVVGRPAGIFAYNRDYQHVLCLCLDYDSGAGVATVRCAVADALGRVIRREDRNSKQFDYTRLEELVGEFLEADSRIAAAGIGIPGVAENGQVEFCEIKSLESVDIAGLLGKKYGVEILVENNMTFVTYGLHVKLTGQAGDLAAVLFPKGSEACIGCGFMINGRIHHGASMMAGEMSYIARGFGISREEQQQMLEERGLFRRLAAQILLTIICTVNPKHVVFMGNGVSRADLPEIEKNCLRVVHKRHIPALTIDNDIAENYQNGVIRFLLDTKQYRYSM